MQRDNREITLTFHGIGTPPVEVDPDERPYWIDQAEFETLMADLAAATREQRLRLVVTFDDGNLSDLRIAAPVLCRHGLAGKVFPCAGRLGRPGYLDRSDLRALIAQGFEIGSHGMDHRGWAGLPEHDLQREVVQARQELQAATGQPIQAAALPFGAYDRRALAAARRAGFVRVYSSDPGLSVDGSWFARRFSYRQGRRFDLAAMAAEHGRLSRRALARAKHVYKALR